MKFAVFFVFAAFAFVAQTYATESIDRGIVVDALKIKLTEAKEKLEELLDKTDNFLKEQIAQAKKQVEDLIDQIKEKVGRVNDKVYNAAQHLLDKVGEYEDKITEKLKNKYGKK